MMEMFRLVCLAVSKQTISNSFSTVICRGDVIISTNFEKLWKLQIKKGKLKLIVCVLVSRLWKLESSVKKGKSGKFGKYSFKPVSGQTASWKWKQFDWQKARRFVVESIWRLRQYVSAAAVLRNQAAAEVVEAKVAEAVMMAAWLQLRSRWTTSNERTCYYKYVSILYYFSIFHLTRFFLRAYFSYNYSRNNKMSIVKV